MKLPSISYLDTAENLATAIAGRSHHHGIFQLTDLPVTAPFTDLAATMDLLHANPDVTARLNRAYQKNLVCKDSFGNNKGGPNVDVKRVLDLSPERLHAIRTHDPALLLVDADADADAATTTTTTTTEPLVSKTLAFWQALQDSVAPKLVEAVALAVGSDDVRADAAYNYWLVDYYARCSPAIDTMTQPPRCGEHRDFGTFSLIFATHGGLEVFVDDQWQAVDAPGDDDDAGAGGSTTTAFLLFGWCTQIRSNGRIPAVLHRVRDHGAIVQHTMTSNSADDDDDAVVVVPRRLAAVLFCAPKRYDTPLEPVLRYADEVRQYKSGVRAGQLRGQMARKWNVREGTIKDQDAILEEAEIRMAPNLRTQDDVVRATVQLTAAVVATK